MISYNRDKLTDLDFKLLSNLYEEEELKKVLRKIEDEDYPPQYAIGNVIFIDRLIKVDERVLIPRFETELLAVKLVDYIKKLGLERAKLTDLCTGSGCIAIYVASKISTLKVYAIDKSRDALDVARENAKENGVDVQFSCIDVLENFEKISKSEVLVANPPYVKLDEVVSANTKYEPAMALYPGEDDLIFYKTILKETSKSWKDLKLIAFEIGSTQGEKVKSLSKKYFPSANVTIFKDYGGYDRHVFIQIAE